MTCEWCGGPFVDTTKNHSKRFCSDNCRKRYHDDTVRRGICSRCGSPTAANNLGAEFCRSCRHAVEGERVDVRARKIVAWWAEDVPRREIARRLGMTVGFLGVEMDRLRKKGYDLPRRRPYYGGGRPRVAA